MIRFFHLTDERVLQMPVRRFFALSRQIPRLEAEETLLRVSTIGAAVGGGEGAQRFLDSLREQAGMKRPEANLAAMGIEVIQNG